RCCGCRSGDMVDGRPSGAGPVSLKIGPEPIPSKINAKNGYFYLFFSGNGIRRGPIGSRQLDFSRLDEPFPFGDFAFDVATHLLRTARARRAAPLGEAPADVGQSQRAPHFAVDSRSEERRVGKECRFAWARGDTTW